MCPRTLVGLELLTSPGHRPSGVGKRTPRPGGMDVRDHREPWGGEAETATERGGRSPRIRGRRSFGLFPMLGVEGARSPGEPGGLAAPPRPPAPWGEDPGRIALGTPSLPPPSSPPTPPRPPPAPGQSRPSAGPMARGPGAGSQLNGGSGWGWRRPPQAAGRQPPGRRGSRGFRRPPSRAEPVRAPRSPAGPRARVAAAVAPRASGPAEEAAPRGRRRPLAADRPRQRPPGRAAAGAAGGGGVAEGEGRGRETSPRPASPTARPRALSPGRRPASRCPGPCGGRAPGSAQVRGPLSRGRGGPDRRSKDRPSQSTEARPGETDTKTHKRRTEPQRRTPQRNGERHVCRGRGIHSHTGDTQPYRRPTHTETGRKTRRDTQRDSLERNETCNRHSQMSTQTRTDRGGSAGAETHRHTHLTSETAPHRGHTSVHSPGCTDPRTPARASTKFPLCEPAPPQVSWAGWLAGWGPEGGEVARPH